MGEDLSGSAGLSYDRGVVPASAAVVIGFLDRGVLAPGNSPGKFTVRGDYVQASDATLRGSAAMCPILSV